MHGFSSWRDVTIINKSIKCLLSLYIYKSVCTLAFILSSENCNPGSLMYGFWLRYTGTENLCRFPVLVKLKMWTGVNKLRILLLLRVKSESRKPEQWWSSEGSGTGRHAGLLPAFLRDNDISLQRSERFCWRLLSLLWVSQPVLHSEVMSHWKIMIWIWEAVQICQLISLAPWFTQLHCSRLGMMTYCQV